jgi:hypothetical protein
MMIGSSRPGTWLPMLSQVTEAVKRVLIYSDFEYQAETGEIRKAIKVRQAVVKPISPRPR